MKIKQLYIGHISTLIVGFLIYVLFRTPTLILFSFIKTLDFLNPIFKLRNATILFSNQLPNWFLYALPDGLWLFSYISLTLYLWNNELKPESLFWIFIVPILAIVSEIGQLTALIPGTFDTIDIIMYLLGSISPFIIFKKLLTIKFKTR